MQMSESGSWSFSHLIASELLFYGSVAVEAIEVPEAVPLVALEDLADYIAESGRRPSGAAN